MRSRIQSDTRFRGRFDFRSRGCSDRNLGSVLTDGRVKESRIPGRAGDAAEWREQRGSSIRAGWAQSRRSWGEIGWLLATEHTQPAHRYAKGRCEMSDLMSHRCHAMDPAINVPVAFQNAAKALTTLFSPRGEILPSTYSSPLRGEGRDEGQGRGRGGRDTSHQ